MKFGLRGAALAVAWLVTRPMSKVADRVAGKKFLTREGKLI
jgi:hypothetical protein